MGCCLKARGNTKARGRGKKLLLAQITHSFKLTMLNVHHVTVCMKCEQNILGLGIPPPIILSLTIFSVAAIFRSLHGSRVRSHCICASVRPAGSPPVSQIVILKTLFSFWRVEQAVGSQTVHVASENWLVKLQHAQFQWSERDFQGMIQKYRVGWNLSGLAQEV